MFGSARTVFDVLFRIYLTVQPAEFVAKSTRNNMRRSASFLNELLHIRDNMLTLKLLNKSEVVFMSDYLCKV
jgi:hypothetical protein